MKGLVFTVVSVTLPPCMAFAQEAPGIDPLAVEIAMASSSYLAQQPRLSVGWLVTYDEIEDGREKRTSVWAGDSLLVRGQGFRSSSTEGTEVRDYIFDGSAFTAVFADEAQFAQVDIPGDFAALVAELESTYDFPLPMAELFDQSGAAAGIAAATDAVYVGEVLFGFEAAHHLAFRGHSGDWEMWISTNQARPVPLMMTGSTPHQHGWPKFQAIFYDWDFEPVTEDGVFAFTSPEGFEEIELEPVEGEE